jgi:HlyD family secretion protein
VAGNLRDSERAARLRDDLESLRLPPERKRPGPRPAGAPRPGGWRPSRGLLALAAVTLLAAGAIAWRVWGTAPLAVETAAAVPYAEAAREPVPILSGTGYLVPAQPFIAIGSRVAGRIERYRVEEGDRVKAGDPLVELEHRPFEATVEQAEAARESARARLSLAESELRRARELAARDVVSRDELETRESAAKAARAQVRELDAAARRARIDLEDAVIRAPTDGVVLETFKQPGEVAVPGGFSGSGDLLRLANLAELRAELDVNEADLPRVRLGQHAEVTPDAYPEAHYAALVVKLAPQVDRQKGTREVEVRVLEPDDRLLPDMSVRVVFLADLYELDPGAAAGESASRAGAVIPRAALHRGDDGRAHVWVVEGGRARRVSVEAEPAVGDRVVVRAGLTGGERVIVGTPPERDGQRVEAIPAGAA